MEGIFTWSKEEQKRLSPAQEALDNLWLGGTGEYVSCYDVLRQLLRLTQSSFDKHSQDSLLDLEGFCKVLADIDVDISRRRLEKPFEIADTDVDGLLNFKGFVYCLLAAHASKDEPIDPIVVQLFIADSEKKMVTCTNIAGKSLMSLQVSLEEPTLGEAESVIAEHLCELASDIRVILPCGRLLGSLPPSTRLAHVL